MTTVAAPKKVIAIIVMAAFIMVCVLAPFGAAHAIVGISTVAVTILIAGLAAIGITFASTGGFDTLNDYVESLLQEYASDNNIPVTSIFNGTQYSSSAAGKLLLNNRFVTLIDTFAQWIIGKYSLSDNNNVTVQTVGASFDGYTSYSLPLRNDLNTPGYYNYWVKLTSSAECYALLGRSSNTSNISVICWSEEPCVVNRTQYNAQGGVVSSQDYQLVEHNNGIYFEVCGNMPASSANDFIWYNTADIVAALRSSDPVIDENNIGIGIDVGTISLPSDNLDYTSGDGAILDVGASWGETTGGAVAAVPDIWPEWLPQSETLTANPEISIEYEAEAVLEESLPQPSDIENLPGSTIPDLSDIPSFEFHSLWHYVAQWISDMSAGGAVLWNICVQAPPAIVNLVFAGIVLAMWFGAIKILR